MNCKFRSFRANALTLMVALFSLTGASFTYGGSVEVTASVLNVRTGPGTSHTKIGAVQQGQKYVSSRTQGSWHQIDFDQRKGWVHGSYLRSSSAESVTVNVSTSLNVRAGAGSQYRDVGDTLNGQQWVVRTRSGVWTKVDYRGGSYWMHGSYLSSGGSSNPINEDLPVSSAGLIQVPNTGAGFTTYLERSNQWGTPKMVYGLMRASRNRINDNSNQGRVSIGRISKSSGDRPSTTHQTHYSGKYADIRPLGKDKYESRIDLRPEFGTSHHYDRTRTRAWINTYLRNEFGGSMTTPAFNDQTLINEGVSRFVGGHHNHIHIKVN